MKFDEALERFRIELLKEYGPIAENGLIKIGLSHDLFNRAVLEMFHRDPRFSLSDIAKVSITGIRLIPVIPDQFEGK